MTYSFPELNVFAWETIGEILSLDGDRGAGATPQFTAGLRRSIAELIYGGQSQSELDEATNWLRERQNWSTCRVFDLLLNCVSPRLGIEKSASTAAFPSAMRRVCREYPGARFLHLTRHPVTAVESMLKIHLNQASTWDRLTDIPILATYYTRLWCLIQQAILEFTATIDGSMTLLVSAERFMSEPIGHATQVAKWLGLQCDSSEILRMIHPERSAFASPVAGSGYFENDLDFMQRPTFRPRQATHIQDFPASWKLSDSLSSDARLLAEKLQYQ